MSTVANVFWVVWLGDSVLPSVTYHHALSEGAKPGPAVSPLGAYPSLQVTASEGFTLTFTWLLLSYH